MEDRRQITRLRLSGYGLAPTPRRAPRQADGGGGCCANWRLQRVKGDIIAKRDGLWYDEVENCGL
jgi:hypothetical protein